MFNKNFTVKFIICSESGKSRSSMTRDNIDTLRQLLGRLMNNDSRNERGSKHIKTTHWSHFCALNKPKIFVNKRRVRMFISLEN